MFIFKKSAAKFLFCVKISSSIKVLWKLINNSKKYSYNYKHNIFDSSQEVSQYELKLFNRSIPLFIRTYTGDFDIFYEIFWMEVYKAPKNMRLNEAKTIVDLGANVGFFTIYYALRIPNANFICVEPEKNNVECLRKNTKIFPNIHIEANGIYSKNTQMTLSPHGNYSYNFFLSEEPAQASNSIYTITIPDLIKKYDLSRIDLLKIDIEGAEADLLCNENSWLNIVESIFIEIHNDYSFEDLCNSLKPFGFKVFSFPNSHSIYYAIK